ncbi:MAG: fatty acid desaturase [Hyphomicrobiaceae bacterium]
MPYILRRIEWPTAWLAAGDTVAWAALISLIGAGHWWLWPLAVLTMTLHSSLQHEALHGHPTSNRYVNEAFVFLPVGLAYPYRRFKTLHLQHHHDERLTDPFEDPESNYMSPEDWAKAGPILQGLRLVNNTQVGRLIIGPAFSVIGFLRGEWALARAGDRSVLVAWLLHLIGMVPVFWWVTWVSGIHPVVYALGFAYPALSLLSVRTFIEHQAAIDAPHRTIINEDRGLFAFLFLFNNLHFVHHSHPTVAWYRLPGLYRANRDAYLAGNGGYFARSYGEVLRRYGLRRKELVEHPLMKRGRWR